MFKNFSRRSLTLGALGALLVVLFAARTFTNTQTPPAQPPKIVEVETVARADLIKTAEFIGVIRARQQATLRARTNGALRIAVRAGQHVNKGDLIATLENPDTQQNYALMQEAAGISKSQLDRTQALLESGISSKTALETKRHAHLEAQKKIADAKADTQIRAPFDGIVGLFKVREGFMAQSGDVITSLYDPTALLVEFDTPLSVAKQVQDGSPVFVNNKEYPLTFIQKMLDEDTHMCPAVVEFSCDTCMIGTAIPVRLVTQVRRGVITVPFEAVFLRDGNNFVYRVKDQKASLTPVKLGLREKERVEIIGGLEVSDVVVIRGHGRLYPDVAVALAKPESPS